MSKLKVFESFAGYGSQSLALKRLNVDFEVVAISEIDKYAIKAYEALHGSVLNLGDISKINPSIVPDHDLFTYSFPCFIAGTKVLTSEGFKNIEEIKKDDIVLTHQNRYRKVVKHMINKANHIYRLKTMVSDDIFVTEEHPFYVRKKSIIWNNDKRVYNRVFGEPEWVKVKDLSKDYYGSIAINPIEELPSWDGIVFDWKDGRQQRKSSILKEKFNMPEFWWLIGRYLGDGWLRYQGGIIICCAFNETSEITNILDILKFNYSIVKERTVNKIHISFKEIGAYCEQFGRGAANKKLTKDILNLPKYLLKSFIEGYVSADGSINEETKVIRASSVSNELIYGIGQCVAKAYNRPFSISKYIRANKHIIENRIVNQKPSYEISWKIENKKQDKAFYENGYLWFPIRDIERLKYDGLVYNMEVEDDNSYVVQNIICHNCTDISGAGKQEGLNEGSGTRSSLLWECKKIIHSKKPTFLLMENVKNLVSKNHIDNFNIWLKWLEDEGYKNYWKVLNAKDYGIPQNRERIFVISILGEHKPYVFPDKIELNIRLKDILEEDVDEKYFVPKNIQEKYKPYNKPCDKEKNVVNRLGGLFDNDTKHQAGSVYDVEGISPCLDTMQGGYRQPCIQVIGKLECKGWYDVETKVHDINGIAPTLVTKNRSKYYYKNRIRKLMPIECFKLMGVYPDEFRKIESCKISNTQLYKLAGNSIVVNVLESIFKNMLETKNI